jgi:hypothetical protein
MYCSKLDSAIGKRHCEGNVSEDCRPIKIETLGKNSSSYLGTGAQEDDLVEAGKGHHEGAAAWACGHWALAKELRTQLLKPYPPFGGVHPWCTGRSAAP